MEDYNEHGLNMNDMKGVGKQILKKKKILKRQKEIDDKKNIFDSF